MLAKEKALEQIKALVEKYKSNLALYQDVAYNESETRNEFIDPFWRALGWDIENQEGDSPVWKEVQVERTQKTEGNNKRPDYKFIHARTEKIFFFVEAKKPYVKLNADVSPLLQTRNYGWQGKTKISIAMNFEEFVVCDCTKKPQKNNTIKSITFGYFTYKDYIEKFDFFWDNFAKENVYNGSIYDYAKKLPDIQPKDSVDARFLLSLEAWRKYLATNIAEKNKHLEDFELNFVVQQILDRMIFLKIAEDRKIEPENQLINATKKGNIYQNIIDLFLQADERYNSGLFNFKKDNLSKNLKIDSKILQNIVKELYEGDDSAESKEEMLYAYRFDIIPVEILGYAYEQFLGNVIIITPQGSAEVTQKPEVRKAGGVYYTPVEVVNYIVENTLGVQIAGKTPEEVAEIKILDPSCGSGSFLLGAYHYLLQWHLAYYLEAQKKAGKRLSAYLNPNNQLTTQVKKQILLHNIFGVDIDEQAVEVSKLSLLIKCLEGETQASIKTHEILYKTQILPSLEDNILCGNSLINHDYYEGKLFPTPREMRKINVFDWKIGFPNILKKSGFDIIIGNPPYGANFLEGQKQYLKERYLTSDIEIESYLLFIEKTQRLLKNDGYCSLIVPSNLLTNIRYEKTRVFLLKNTSIEKVLDLGSNVFKQASVDTCIFITHKKNKTNHNVKAYIGGLSLEKNAKLIFDYQEFSQEQFSKNSHSIFNIYSSQKADDIADKIQKFGEPLGTIVKIARGVEFGYTSDYIVKNKKKKNAKPIIAGRCINRYDLIFEEKYVLYDEKDIKNFKEKIIYESDKILLRRIGHNIIAIFDNQQYYNVCDVYNLLARNGTNLKYLLALLNSKLMSFYLNTKFKNSKKLFPKISIAYLEQLPIRKIDNTNADEQKKMNDAILLVDKIMELHKILQTKLIPKDKDMYERMIKGLDNQIDTIVYELYELTPEEIDLIENYE